MAVTRKPVPKASEGASLPHASEAEEARVREFIERGGKVAGEARPESARKLLQLRMPVDLLARVDHVLKIRAVPPSRHNWILEAIHEKLAREEGAA